MTLERKYGDSLNFEDLHGRPGKPKKKKHLDDSHSQFTATENKTGLTDAMMTHGTAQGTGT